MKKKNEPKKHLKWNLVRNKDFSIEKRKRNKGMYAFLMKIPFFGFYIYSFIGMSLCACFFFFFLIPEK